MMRNVACWLIGLVLWLSACSKVITPSATQTTGTIPTGVLTPYHTPTLTATRPAPTFKVTIPVTPSPTSTPFLHTITNDDTMLGLAFRYGVSLEALKTANPSVNPNAMTVGSQLIIPINVEISQEIPTSTPAPVGMDQPRCIRSGDGGAWCIVALHNDSGVSVENLSVWIGLYDLQGQNFTSQVAYAALDILLPGNIMPLLAYFGAPLPDEFNARVELLTASAIPAGDTRYMDAQIKVSQVDITSVAGQAVIQGDVILPQGSTPPSQVWVLAVAYDAGGNIVGMRKWKSISDTHFDVIVYGLGGVINHVDVLAEVRP